SCTTSNALTVPGPPRIERQYDGELNAPEELRGHFNAAEATPLVVITDAPTKPMQQHQLPTDKTDKTGFVGFVSAVLEAVRHRVEPEVVWSRRPDLAESLGAQPVLVLVEVLRSDAAT